MFKQGKVRKSPRVLMLFNDALFICKPVKIKGEASEKLIPKEFYPLDEVQLDEDTSRGLRKLRHAIKVKRKTEKEEDFVVIGFEDEDTREMWVTLIGITAQSFIARQRRAAGETSEYGWTCKLHKGNLFYHVYESMEKEVATQVRDPATDVNVKNNEGQTALHIAVSVARPAMGIVKLLLEGKSNPNIRDRDRNPPLTLAVTRGLGEVSRALLAAGADANSIGKDNGYPLQRALENGDEGLISALLEGKADPTLKARNGKNSITWWAALEVTRPLFQLVFEASLQVRDELFKEKDAFGSSITHLVASQGFDEKLALIIARNRGAVTERNAMTGETPLHYAARNNERRAADILIASGAFPNANDSKGNTPLHVCARELKAHLVRRGAQPGRVNNARQPATNSAYTDISSAETSRVNATVDDEIDRIVSEGDPDWKSDADYPKCPFCTRGFSMFSRRHHCRACGMVCCAYCSAKKLTTTVEGKPTVRACDVCFNKAELKRLIRRYELRLGGAPAGRAGAGGRSSPTGAGGDAKRAALAKKTKPEPLTSYEKKLLQDRNPQTQQEKIAYKRAIEKKYGFEAAQAKSGGVLSATKGLMAENQRLMAQRGEQLNEANQKAEELSAAAGGLNKLARKIREKQQKRWI